jgi:hypothetical protein
MPARQILAFRKTSPRNVRRQPSRQRINGILSRREQLVAELALLRQQGAESKFIDNAQQLLTRWWSGATWDGRDELLKSADWLIRLEKNHGARAEPSA